MFYRYEHYMSISHMALIVAIVQMNGERKRHISNRERIRKRDQEETQTVKEENLPF